MAPDTHCVLCSDDAHEDIDHLFFQRDFSLRCWQRLGIQWDKNNPIQERVIQAKQNSSLPFFMDICIVAMWEIWKLRNRKVFDGQQASVNLWLHHFKEEAHLQSMRLKESLRPAIVSWINSL
ncbi:hypothetical protein BS78_05G154900 [Paspalum vaginatum]|nr:hypothetical protein BS78_05G154900 [Paspalum vaginatum]